MYRSIVVLFILSTSLLYSQIPGFAGDKLFLLLNKQVLRQSGPGPTFQLINFGDTSKSVNALFFINSTTGYASRGGRIFKTTDTGDTWAEILNTNSLVDLDKITAAENTIFIFGGNNQLYRSFNGGISFDSVTVNLPITNYSWFTFLGISKASKVYLYAPYFNPFQGAIHYLKSTDSCRTWTEIPSLGEKGYSHFVNTDFGHLSTMSKVYTTTNGGDSWVMKHEEEGVYLVRRDGLRIHKQDIRQFGPIQGLSEPLMVELHGHRYIKMAAILLPTSKPEAVVWSSGRGLKPVEIFFGQR
ncbi:MAG: hypothetical protein IPJ75_19735 [Ignavibacteriales bacterium]|nr:hypothetical protein [Ignavibacteriales bacterium]